MKNVYLLAVVVFAGLFFATKCAAQTDTAAYSGAKATKKEYRAAFQLNSDDDAKIKATLRNMENSLADERLAGKLKLELVVHGAGIKIFMKGGAYEEELKTLKQKGVILAECLNTMRERNVTKDQLYDFIGFVPSGNGELIILEQQGWAIIHP